LAPNDIYITKGLRKNFTKSINFSEGKIKKKMVKYEYERIVKREASKSLKCV